MKELTTLNNKFTESEVKKGSKFSRSSNFNFTCIHFNIYEFLKWLESHFGENTKFGDMSPKVVCKKGVLDIFAKFTKKHLCQRLFLKK